MYLFGVKANVSHSKQKSLESHRMEYKAYHEQQRAIFHSQANLYFSQCQADGDLSLHELLKITSDTAVEDYRRRGLSRENLIASGFGVLVSRCSYRIHKWPRENDFVEIVTWEEKPLALQLMRCYKVLAENGEVLVSGRSTWSVIDAGTWKLIPTKRFTVRDVPDFSIELDCDEPAKIVLPPKMELLEERLIRFSDIDANSHVNNSRYAAFVEDALPKEWQERKVRDFKINFLKEATLGEKIAILGGKQGNTFFFEGRTAQAISFEASISF